MSLSASFMLELRRRNIAICILALTVGAALQIYWLALESHDVYGDEGWHLLMILNQTNRFIRTVQIEPLKAIARFYLYQDNYPPLAHLFSLPFTLIPAHKIFWSRVYMSIVSLGFVFSFTYISFELYGKRIASVLFIGLFASALYMEASHYFLVEMPITLCTFLMCMALARYIEFGKRRTLLAASLILSIGLLVKFSFVVYAAPVFLALFIILVARFKRQQATIEKLTQDAGLFAVVPALVAGPWYLYQLRSAFLGGTGTLGSLNHMLVTGHLKAGHSGAEILIMFENILAANFHWPIYVVIAVIIILGGWFALRRREVALADEPFKFWLLASCFSIVLIPLVNIAIGLGTTYRWSPLYPFILLVAGAGLRYWPPKYQKFAIPAVGATLATGALVMQFSALSLDGYRLWARTGSVPPLVDREPTGMRETAAKLAAYEQRSGFNSNFPIPTFFHVHQGAHVGALTLHLYDLGSRLRVLGLGAYNHPVDLDLFAEAPMLLFAKVDGRHRVITSANFPNGTPTRTDLEQPDPEWHRYATLIDNLPESYWASLQQFASVKGRYGEIVAEVPRSTRRSRELLQGLVDTAAKVAVEDMEKINVDIFRLSYGLVEVSDTELIRRISDIRRRIEAANGTIPPHVAAGFDIRLNRIEDQIIPEWASPVRSVTGLHVKQGDAGWIDTVEQRNSCLMVSGWAAFPNKKKPALGLLVFANGVLVGAARHFYLRPDVAQAFATKEMGGSGFSLCIPRSKLINFSEAIRITAFALDEDGSYGELSGARVVAAPSDRSERQP